MGDNVINALVAILDDSDKYTRYHACKTLGIIAFNGQKLEDSVINALVARLNDSDQEVLDMAYETLSKITSNGQNLGDSTLVAKLKIQK